MGVRMIHNLLHSAICHALLQRAQHAVRVFNQPRQPISVPLLVRLVFQHSLQLRPVLAQVLGDSIAQRLVHSDRHVLCRRGCPRQQATSGEERRAKSLGAGSWELEGRGAYPGVSQALPYAIAACL